MAVHRELKLDDYLTIVRRRRWMIVIPALLGAATGYILSLRLPKRYTSHTVILVQQPTVPDSYVKPVVSEDLNQRLASMREQILSRTRLQQLVEHFGLFKTDSGWGPLKVVSRLAHKGDVEHPPMEDLVKELHKLITVTPLNPMAGTRSAELPGFNVDVTLGEARLAQQVCQEITSMFMEQNLRLRQQQVEETTQFLGKELDDAKAKLDEQDAKLAAFQSRHIGELPEDENTNLTLLAGMTPQLQAATQGLNQAQQDKVFTESLLDQQLGAWRASKGGQSSQTVEQQLRELQDQLLSKQGHYTELHPDVVKLKKDIASLQKLANASTNVDAQPNEQQRRAAADEPAEIQQFRARLHQIELTIAQKKHEQEEFQRQIKILQARIQSSPIIQQQFKGLTRDHQTALDFYNDLLKKRNESQMATELERRQEGQQFRVLDPPSLPERPSFPKPTLFGLGGLAAGLILGLAMVQFSESYDKSMRTKQDVELYLGGPALALISSMDAAQKRKKRMGDAVFVRTRLHLRASSSRR
jgi:polysaccharide chain length determinant protein (PEP-CTERM system associated)